MSLGSFQIVVVAIDARFCELLCFRIIEQAQGSTEFHLRIAILDLPHRFTHHLQIPIGRPSNRDLEVVCEAVRQIKDRYPEMELCTSLGLLNDAKAQQLAEAGVDRYNHNLETSEGHFGEVVTTHSYGDRVETIEAAASMVSTRSP